MIGGPAQVHQGDGTASICAGNPSIYTLSVHCQSNFPAKKMASSRDVGLPDGTGDAAFLSAVAEELGAALQEFKPCICLYDAGAARAGGSNGSSIVCAVVGVMGCEC